MTRQRHQQSTGTDQYVCTTESGYVHTDDLHNMKDAPHQIGTDDSDEKWSDRDGHYRTERQNMTVEKLIEKFSIDNDRMLL